MHLIIHDMHLTALIASNLKKSSKIGSRKDFLLFSFKELNNVGNSM